MHPHLLVFAVVFGITAAMLLAGHPQPVPGWAWASKGYASIVDF
jgi:hypothetical protein